MKIQRYSGLYFSAFITILLVSLVLVNSSIAKNKGKTEHTDKLLKALAQDKGKDINDLEILNEVIFSLPNIEGKYPAAKIMDKKSGEIHGITIDVTGNKVDKEVLLEENLKIHRVKYGKLEPALFDKLQTADEKELIEVGIWIDAPDDEPLKRPTTEDLKNKGEYLVEMERRALGKEKKSKIFKNQEPVVEHLKEMNADILDVDELTPVIATKLNKNQIENIASHQKVSAIYLSSETQPALHLSAQTIGADVVWGRGFTGQGQYVAIVEREGIVSDNSNLYVYRNRDNSCFNKRSDPSDPNSLTNHATQVAGVVGNHDSRYSGWFKGMAYNANLIGASTSSNCSSTETYLWNATTWAYNNFPVFIFNNSFGTASSTITQIGRQQDSAVYNWYATMVDAAGNCNPNCRVASPANAYNVIAVGAQYKMGGGMWPSSSYINPTSSHGDREKPEIAAPGADSATGIITTGSTSNSSPGSISYTFLEPPFQDILVQGTSLAAPHVAGGAALLMNRNSYLQSWSETIKAILMATAIHNQEGNERLSDVDGAGGINLDAADQVASDASKWTTNTISSSSFDSYYGNMDYYFTASANQTVRAAIVWDTSTTYAYYDSQPAVDLDLFVYSPSGAILAGSGSFDNTYEIVQFTAPETGVYKLQIHNFRFNMPSTYLGVAWYNYSK